MNKQAEIKEAIIQGVNMILLHNLVRIKPTANYIDINEAPKYREWLESEIDEQIIKPLQKQGVVIMKEFVPPYLPSIIEREGQIMAIVEPLVKE